MNCLKRQNLKRLSCFSYFHDQVNTSTHRSQPAGILHHPDWSSAQWEVGNMLKTFGSFFGQMTGTNFNNLLVNA